MSLSLAVQTFPTPTTMDGRGTLSLTALRKPGGTGKLGMTLNDFVNLYPTPTAACARQGMSQHDGRRGQTLVGALVGQNWAPPRASDATRGRWENHGRSMNTRPLCEQLGGRPNPEFVEWLMGWPINHTACAPLDKASFRQWLLLHGVFFR